ncbi:hypothetical protein [Nocardia sp. NPDC057030]|uniref:hypothetical protein n=1 Tax=unclassified Nocardia TaxID=2637762 RepID=UPI0036406220
MTNPGGPSGLEPGQWGVTGKDGSITAKTGHTQANVTQTLQDQFTSDRFSSLNGGLVAMIISFIVSAIAGILGGFATVIEAIFGIVDNGYVQAMPVVQAQAGSISATKAAVVTTSIISGQTVTRYVYTGAGTWTKPSAPAGKRISRIAAACINGGNGGNGPPGINGEGAEGGEGGGYAYAEWKPDEVPATVTITVGALGNGGPTNSIGQVGGVSSFGSLLSGKAGTSSIRTAQGAVGSTCAPGRGGNGGGGAYSEKYEYASPGLRGQSTALSSGGNGGPAHASGATAGITATDPQIYSGGGGGGGGGGSLGASGSIGTALRPGGGGAGTAPGGGGGGGGGGQRGGIGVGPFLPGGPGGNGAVVAWVYMEDIT